MGAKLHKVTIFVTDFRDEHSHKDLIREFESMKFVDGVYVYELETIDVGEWHDDHELNNRSIDREKYFNDRIGGKNISS